jgi:tripartite-type tricarboxylate transporter receptor subunit TctC
MKNQGGIVKRIVAMVAVCLASQAWAQGYPTKPIRVVSPFSSGNPADVLVRLQAQKMSVSMGQPIVIEPNTVASGVGAAQIVMRAPPDGYTLLYALPSQIMIPPFLIREKPFDPMRDFTPITSATDAHIGIFVANSFPPRSVKELIAYAKANPGKVAYGTNGIGGTYHLEMELFKQQFGIEATQVPYKGTVDSVNALMAGDIPMVYGPLGSLAPLMKAGKVRMLVLLDYKRAPEIPDVPAMGEEISGYVRIPTGLNFYGPASLPTPVTQRIYTETVKALRADDLLAKIKEYAFYPLGTPPEELQAKHKRDFEIIARAVKAAKLEAQ